MNAIQYVRRLPLAGAPNTRDLGGYPCQGGMTRWGMFLRSASPANFLPEDIEALKQYGLTAVVDLRSDDECSRQPSKLLGVEGLKIHRIPLLDQINSANFEGDLPGSMSGLYISLLNKNGNDFVRIFEIFAEEEGCVLFNCTAGKDRTGMAAMLLLGLAGVNESDIEADYAMTEIYMAASFNNQKEELKKIGISQSVPEFVFRSMPESMRRTSRHLRENWGSAEGYLLDAGLPEETIERVKKKFVVPA